MIERMVDKIESDGGRKSQFPGLTFVGIVN
jgi:hypothetical protein